MSEEIDDDAALERKINKKQRISDEEDEEEEEFMEDEDNIQQNPGDDSPHSKKQQQKQIQKRPNLPFTQEGNMPQKRFYRCRAHCNPLSHNDIFEYPTHPNLMDWSDHFPLSLNTSEEPEKQEEQLDLKHQCGGPDVLDIGCGFGGLTIALAKVLPTKKILGIEIRPKVAEYVRLRIVACRKEYPGFYNNCSVLRNNTMKYMPNFFHKSSLEKIFICFPDPHFKKKNFPRRIVSERLLTEYAYFLKPGGLLYLITDVKDLHDWHVEKCQSHPMFDELTLEEMGLDPCVKVMYSETEEGKKVERTKGNKYYAVYRRISNEDVQKKCDSIQPDNFWKLGEFGVSVYTNTINE